MMLSNLDTPRNLQNAGPTITLTLDQSQLAGNSIDPTMGVTTTGETKTFRKIDRAKAAP